uniref:Uncharacterized protein n=1 Tax=Providencia stuartii TaxID=588 RepID=A0AAI9DAC8_PROST|nr:hypothetical protein [Providencia stuartii]
MEKLQQLASTIAQIYVDGLKAETGTTLVTYNGITGEVIPELLARRPQFIRLSIPRH